MSSEHTIPAQDVWDVAAPVVDSIAQEVSAKIRELNGDKTVSACFVVGAEARYTASRKSLRKTLTCRRKESL